MGDVQVTKRPNGTMLVTFIRGFGKRKAAVKSLDVTGKSKDERDILIQAELERLRTRPG